MKQSELKQLQLPEPAHAAIAHELAYQAIQKGLADVYALTGMQDIGIMLVQAENAWRKADAFARKTFTDESDCDLFVSVALHTQMPKIAQERIDRHAERLASIARMEALGITYPR